MGNGFAVHHGQFTVIGQLDRALAC
jgi:hypothetical protein